MRKRMDNKTFIAFVLVLVLVTALVVVISNFIPNSEGITGWAGKGVNILSSTCSDSDVSLSSPNGRNFYEKGFIEGSRRGLDYTSEDYCNGDNLFEYFCREDGTSLVTKVNCENGCIDGACSIIESKLGDLNFDSFIDVSDLTLMNSLIDSKNFERKSPNIRRVADLDFNGLINIEDRDLLNKYLLGEITSFDRPILDSFEKKFVPVLEIVYIPTNESNQKVDFSKTKDWKKSDLNLLREHIDKISKITIEALERGSSYHGYKDLNSQPYLDYYVIDRKEYLREAPLVGGYGVVQDGDILRADLNKILKENGFDICDYVDNQGVREVWLYIDSKPSNGVYGAVESFQIGPDISFGNGGYRQGTYPICEKSYTVYGTNFGRGPSESIHNHMHHIERNMAVIDPSFYDSFSGHKKEFQEDNYGDTFLGCGWSHCPNNVITGMCFIDSNQQKEIIEQMLLSAPAEDDKFDMVRNYNKDNCLNSQDTSCMCIKGDGVKVNGEEGIDYSFCEDLRDKNTCICQGYNWFSQREILTDCENWRPDGSGEITSVSCNTWSETENGKSPCVNSDPFKDGEIGFYVWWMQNIPGYGNGIVYNEKEMMNFWDFIADFSESRKISDGMYKKDLSIEEPSQDPVANSCIDSDGGSSIGIKGNISVTEEDGSESVYFDVCVSESKVREFVCNAAGNPGSSTYDCTTGFSCVDGACELQDDPVIEDPVIEDPVTEEPPTEEPQDPSPSQNYCIDTDSGLDRDNFGSVRYSDKYGEGVSEDFCVNIGRVQEYYCSSRGSRAYVSLDCGLNKICKNGACVSDEGYCTSDSDCDSFDKLTCTQDGKSVFNNNYYCDLGDNTCKAGYSSTIGCSDSNECTIDSCSNGACSNLFSPVGTSCAGGTGTCDGTGNCLSSNPICRGTPSYVSPAGSVSCNSEDPNSVCNNIKDGFVNTKWVSATTTDPQEVIFDFGSKKCLSGIKVNPTLFNQRTNIEVSDDGVIWTKVGGLWTLSSIGSFNERTFGEIKTRYVRLDFYDSPSRTSINEIQVKSRDYF